MTETASNKLPACLNGRAGLWRRRQDAQPLPAHAQLHQHGAPRALAPGRAGGRAPPGALAPVHVMLFLWGAVSQGSHSLPSFPAQAEEANDPGHYVPPWTYNPADGRGKKAPVTQEQAMQELVEVVRRLSLCLLHGAWHGTVPTACGLHSGGARRAGAMMPRNGRRENGRVGMKGCRACLGAYGGPLAIAGRAARKRRGRRRHGQLMA